MVTVFHCYFRSDHFFPLQETHQRRSNSSNTHCRHHLVFKYKYIERDKNGTHFKRNKVKTQSKHLIGPQSWERVFNDSPFWSVAFKTHRIKSNSSTRGGPVFACSDCCLFDDCPVKANIKVQDKFSLKAEVTFAGGFVSHRLDKIRRQPVRGHERDILSQTLTTILPRSVFLESLWKLDHTVVASGYRDQVPVTGIMKAIL